MHRRRGQFFVRLVLKRDGIRSYTRTPLTTAIDFYVDSGTGEWLIPRYMSAMLQVPHATPCTRPSSPLIDLAPSTVASYLLKMRSSLLHTCDCPCDCPEACRSQGAV